MVEAVETDGRDQQESLWVAGCGLFVGLMLGLALLGGVSGGLIGHAMQADICHSPKLSILQIGCVQGAIGAFLGVLIGLLVGFVIALWIARRRVRRD
jgi:hypothetical protein